MRFMLLAAVLGSVGRSAEPGLKSPAVPTGAPDVEVAERSRSEPRIEPGYHSSAELYALLDALISEKPGVVRRETVASSVEGRRIYGFRLCDPATKPIGKLLIFANIHAMEWVPTEIALEFAKDFTAQPISGVEVVIVPTLNIDGRARVEADLAAGRNVYRRGNANGVDLNRDFSVNREATAAWKAVIPRRYAVSKSALSQPETQAIDALAATELFDAAVSLHAFGGFFYYPWAGRWERAADWQELHRLGTVMQGAMVNHPYKPRQLSRWGFFFRGQGMEVDHLYGEYGTLSFLVETTRSGIEQPADLGTYFRWYNPRNPAPHIAEGVRYLRALAVEVATGRARHAAPPASSAPADAPPASSAPAAAPAQP